MPQLLPTVDSSVCNHRSYLHHLDAVEWSVGLFVGVVKHGVETRVLTVGNR